VEPSLQNLKKPLNISTVALDNYALYDLWIEIINPDGNVIYNNSMNYNLVFEKFYLNQSYANSGIYMFTIWANDTSDNWASSTGSFEIEPDEEPEEYNWKPMIAFLFVIILLIIGIMIVLIHPMRFTGDLGKDRTYSFFAGVMPFVVAEVITGVASFFTGLLAVPPVLGLGLIVDLAILIAGIVSCIVIYLKGIPSKSYEEVTTPPPSEPQTSPKTFHLDSPQKSPTISEKPSPSPPQESEEKTPPSSPSSPFE
jgi:hypothetical protein